MKRLEVGNILYSFGADNKIDGRHEIIRVDGRNAYAEGIYFRRYPTGGRYDIPGVLDPNYGLLGAPHLEALYEKHQMCQVLRDFDWESLDMETLKKIASTIAIEALKKGAES